MILRELQVHGVRNLEVEGWTPAPGLNYLEGANGSGKSSILEALFLLGRGRSFRERSARPVIRDGVERAIVFGRYEETEGREVRIGIEKARGSTEARINGEGVRGVSDLAMRNPIGLFTSRSVELLEGSPEARRRFLDWGVFHVEHNFREVAERYRRALKQRNASLRHSISSARHWDGPLAIAGDGMQAAREGYLSRLFPLVDEYLGEMLPGMEVDIRLLRGWGDGSLPEALEAGIEADLRNGFTGVGPHRADLSLRAGGSSVRDRLSRGQLKLLVSALILSQARLIHEALSERPMLLFDDFRAELDPANRVKLSQLIAATGCQAFLTANDAPDSATPVDGLFHVEHGRIR